MKCLECAGPNAGKTVNLQKGRKMKMRTVEKQDNEAGYSLLEILVVLAIIATLMGLVAPRLLGNVDKSKVIAAKAQVKNLRLALDSFKVDNGRYPTATEGLSVLITAPVNDDGSWFGPYMDGELPLDPWKAAFVYEPPRQNENGRTESPRVISLGADNQPGGTGLNADIAS